jgi:hypothetical protein
LHWLETIDTSREDFAGYSTPDQHPTKPLQNYTIIEIGKNYFSAT